MDGFNECRTARVAELLADFRLLQLQITSVSIEPPDMEDYYTQGWAALRQCSIDGHFILECAADTSVPTSPYGQLEVDKAELQQVLLDACSRRHEGQKILLRQQAVQRWIDCRAKVLQGGRPRPELHPHLEALDKKLAADFDFITDEFIYSNLLAADMSQGRWTVEDPSLQTILHWLRERK